MRVLGAVAVALLLLTGCARRAVDVAPVRLLEEVKGATVDWPSGLQGRVPEGVGGVRSYRQLRKRRVGRVAMFSDQGGEERLAVLSPVGTTHVFEVDVPERAVFRVGLGYLVPEEDQPIIRFLVRVQASGSEGEDVTLLEESLASATARGWKDFEIDVSAWGGQRVHLSLISASAASDASVIAAWSAPEIVVLDPSSAGLDVILVVLDTLRADRLGCYGYDSDTSPRLDDLAAGGIRFATAVSQSPWTRPSHKALFTGLYPTTKGLTRQPVLAELLRDSGYRTEALTGGGQMDFRMGFGRGFESYRVVDWIREFGDVEPWLERSRGRRRFLFLHTYEIHDPYVHTGPSVRPGSSRVSGYFDKKRWEELRGTLTAGERQHIEDLYDNGIRFTDQAVGRLFDLFERRGLLERAIVIVTSDHGEQFWEHGTWRHGMSLHDHQLLVPLIVHLPPGLKRSLSSSDSLSGRVFEEQVRLVDLLPTVLDLLGVGIDHRVDGRSLRPLLEDGELNPVDAFAEELNVAHRESKALRSRRYKYIYSYPKERGLERGLEETRELFDLNRDPGEQVNLAAQYPEQVEELDARLQTLLELLGDPSDLDAATEELDPDLVRRLRALGYIGN